MRIRRLLILTAGLFFAVTGTAGAQEAGKAGITIAYPASIGVIWHATDTVAIRPAFSFAHNTSDVSTGPGESDSANIALDLGVLFYLKKYDNVRTYVSPRFTYLRTTTTVTPNTTQTTQPETRTITNGTGGAGTFGAQYSPSSRFSVYGEVGLAFSHRHTEVDSNPAAGSVKSNTWSTTSGVGVIVYF